MTTNNKNKQKGIVQKIGAAVLGILALIASFFGFGNTNRAGTNDADLIKNVQKEKDNNKSKKESSEADDQKVLAKQGVSEAEEEETHKENETSNEDKKETSKNKEAKEDKEVVNKKEKESSNEKETEVKEKTEGSETEKEVEEEVEETEVVYHLVSYQDENGEELHVESVIHGEDAKGFSFVAPEGLEFTSWDKDLTNIQEDMVVKPVLEVKTFKVQFFDHLRNVIHEETVQFGDSVDLIEAPTIEGYEFVEWSHDGENVRENLEIKPKYEVMSFDVKVQDQDGNILSEQKVNYGSKVNTDLIETPQGHHVVADDLDAVIKEDTVLTVEFAKNTTEVIFKDGNDIIERKVLEFGDKVEYPEAPEKEGHTFVAWSKQVEVVKPEVSHDILVISAEYEANVYDVDFMVDGKLHESVQVEHGKKAEPSKEISAPEGMVFVGWDKDVSSITGNLVVEAKFEIKTYEVKVLGHDGNVIDTQVVEHGSDIKLPEDVEAPEGHHFVKWTHTGKNIKSDVSIKPVFEINKYTVTFLDDNGKTLTTKTVEHGESVEGPNVPSKDGYDFLKWDKDLDKITSDMTVNAVYGLQVKDVVFLDFDGKEVHKTRVEFGKSVEDIPVLDDVVGYTFVGWEQDLNDVRDHMVVNPVFEEKHFEVEYVVNGEVIHTTKVQEGKAADAIEAPVVEGFDFVKWAGLDQKVMSDTQIHAEYKIKEYKVDFVSDGKVIDSQTVKHGESATLPVEPELLGHTFIGWDKPLNNIKADTRITAEFEINTYTVKFDMGGEIIEKKVKHGDKVEYPEPRKIEGKDFVRWDRKVNIVTGDTTVNAVYEAQTFNVVFKDRFGNDLKTEVVEYGKSATAPKAPEVPNMDFVNWDRNYKSIKGDLVVFPIYARQEATLSIKVVVRDHKGNVIEDHDGNKTRTFVLERGTEVEFEKSNNKYTGNLIVDNEDIIELPKYEGFEIKNVKSDVISLDERSQDLEISLYSNEYRVKFYDVDGKLLETVSTYHGGQATPNFSDRRLEVSGKVFVGWDVNVDYVTQDLEARPKYEDAAHTVTFVDHEGNPIKEIKVKHGEKPAPELIPEGPEVEHKIFKRWTNTFVRPVNRDLVVKPMYENKRYRVKFYTGVDTSMQPYRVMTERELEFGDKIPFDKIPDPVARTYIFKGWDTKHDTVTGEMHIYPIFEEDPAAVTIPVEYLDENGKVQVENVRGYVVDGNAEVLGKMVNDYRVANGKQPLAISSKLNEAALQRAAQLTLKFSHDSPTGLSFNKATKYAKYASGENIARGNSTPEATFNQWKRSPGHNSNMLLDGLNRVAYGSAGFYPEVGTYNWVQLFGSGSSVEFIENEANYD